MIEIKLYFITIIIITIVVVVVVVVVVADAAAAAVVVVVVVAVVAAVVVVAVVVVVVVVVAAAAVAVVDVVAVAVVAVVVVVVVAVVVAAAAAAAAAAAVAVVVVVVVVSTCLATGSGWPGRESETDDLRNSHHFNQSHAQVITSPTSSSSSLPTESPKSCGDGNWRTSKCGCTHAATTNLHTGGMGHVVVSSLDRSRSGIRQPSKCPSSPLWDHSACLHAKRKWLEKAP